jgi:hypothetical protein
MVACSEASGSTDMDEEAGARVTASSPSSTMDQGCGCHHCVGTETVVARVTPVESAVPESFNLIKQFPAKVSREPFVPPPESLVAI